MTRAQLVIAAGAVVAVALLAVLGAVLQLGYDPAPDSQRMDPPEETRRVVATLLTRVEPAVRDYAWGEHEAAIQEINPVLRDGIRTLQTDRAGTIRFVDVATGAALDRLATLCPRTEHQSFGPCTVIDGIVLQERAGRTHLVAVVLEVTVVTETRRTALTVVVRPAPRVIER